MRDSRLNVMLSSMSHGVNLEIHATESIRETWKFKRVSSIYREFRLAVMSDGVHDSGDLEIHATTELRYRESFVSIQDRLGNAYDSSMSHNLRYRESFVSIQDRLENACDSSMSHTSMSHGVAC